MLADRVRMAVGKLRRLIDRSTPTVVVNEPYSTEGNGGRKLVRLENGWLVVGTIHGGLVRFYVSKNFGTTWSVLCTVGNTSITMQDFAVASYGARLYVIKLGSNRDVDAYTLDVLTVSGNVSGYKLVDNENALNKCSLEINKEGTELHACWASKNVTYPNSFNIRYCKGIINGDGSVTWGSVEQITNENHSAVNLISPTISLNSQGYPVIIYSEVNGASNTFIRSHYFTGELWVRRNVTTGYGSELSSPSSCVNKDGFITVAWHGMDSIHPSTNYIRFSKSLNNGATWATMKKLVPGINPSLTTDKNGIYYIEYQDGSMVKRIQSPDKGETWSNPVTLDVASNPSTLYDNKFELDFEVPLSIRQTSNSVIFSGKWYE